MKRAKALTVAIAVLTGVLAVGLAVALTSQAGPSLDAAPIPSGAEACSGEFWASHPESWEEYDSNVHMAASLFGPSGPHADDTLMDALRYTGGEDGDGARQTLIRAATVAALNASHESIKFPLRRYESPPTGGLIPSVRNLLAGNDSKAMLSAAAYLDSYSALDCPLD